MTVFYFFGAQLFVIYTGVGHLGLVLATGATAALGFLLRQWPWARLGARQRARARLTGALVAGGVGALLVAGLRVSGTAFDPAAPALFFEWLTAVAAGAGLVAAAYAGAAATAGLVLARAPAPTALPEATAAPKSEIAAAVEAFESLTAAAERLRQSEKEAAARVHSVSDEVAAAEYARACEAIRHRLQLAEELQATTGAALLRMACGAPLRRLLERRPDAELARLNDPKAAAPLGARAAAALAAVRAFLGEVGSARAELARELAGAPGSLAQRVGLDAAERARPFDAALVQLEVSYGRVGHRLEALRLRLGAEADAGAVATAALALTGPSPSPAKDVVEVALEMTQAEQSAATALRALGAEPSRIADVVVHASASLARDSGDDEALADVLRSVRRELES